MGLLRSGRELGVGLVEGYGRVQLGQIGAKGKKNEGETMMIRRNQHNNCKIIFDTVKFGQSNRSLLGYDTCEPVRECLNKKFSWGIPYN